MLLLLHMVACWLWQVACRLGQQWAAGSQSSSKSSSRCRGMKWMLQQLLLHLFLLMTCLLLSAPSSSSSSSRCLDQLIWMLATVLLLLNLSLQHRQALSAGSAGSLLRCCQMWSYNLTAAAAAEGSRSSSSSSRSRSSMGVTVQLQCISSRAPTCLSLLLLLLSVPEWSSFRYLLHMKHVQQQKLQQQDGMQRFRSKNSCMSSSSSSS
jgi:hypothetical protein